MRTRFFLLSLFLLIFTLPLMAQDAKPEAVGLRPDAPIYAVHGPFWVGTHELVLDAIPEHPMPVTVWYPALNPDSVKEAVTYYVMTGNTDMTIRGHALLDDKPDTSKGPYPLIILSHGQQGTRLISPYYAEHLASYGFIVMAPDHYGDVMTAEPQSFDMRLHQRSIDISNVIDMATKLTATTSILKGMVDVEKVAVTGISAGGLTTLLAGGGQINMSHLRDYCKDYPEDGRCPEILDHTKELAATAGLSTVPEGDWPSWGDKRVDAIIPIVPGPQIIGDGAKGISIPTLLVLASADTVVIPKYSGYPVWENLGSANKTLVEFINAEHPFALFKCADGPWLGQVAYPACADAVWDMDRIHDLLDHYSTAFLLDVLKGDKEAHKALMPDSVQFTGIRYETTIK